MPTKFWFSWQKKNTICYKLTCTADILALANTVKIQLKPPRNANSGQVTFLLRDLLDDVKKHNQVLDFVSKMCCVKPFEAIGNQLKDHLMNESILCMNGTLRTVHDQQKEIARMKHFMNSMKDMSVLDSPKRKIWDTHWYPSAKKRCKIIYLNIVSLCG